jgi:hypothetical protein
VVGRAVRAGPRDQQPDLRAARRLVAGHRAAVGRHRENGQPGLSGLGARRGGQRRVRDALAAGDHGGQGRGIGIGGAGRQGQVVQEVAPVLGIGRQLVERAHQDRRGGDRGRIGLVGAILTRSGSGLDLLQLNSQA